METLPDLRVQVWWIAAIAIAAPVFAGSLAILFHINSRERSRWTKQDPVDIRCNADTRGDASAHSITPLVPRR
jgi:hypothetical protein